jgi:hypothetical protein
MGSRVDLYKKLLRQVAKQLGEKTTADIVKHVATLKLMRENIQIRLLAGERVDPGDVVKIDECLKRYLPDRAPLKVEVEFIDSLPSEPTPDPPPPEPPPAPPPTDTKPSSPSEPSNVVPLRPAEDREAVLRACAPPLKRGNEPWRGHVGPVGDPYGSVNPFGTFGDIPNFSAAYRGRL